MDLEKRLICAQMLNQLLKQERIIKVGPKVDQEIALELDGFIKKQLNNLLLKVMGEQTDELFNNEEIQILKTFAAKIKNQASTKYLQE